MSFGIATHLSIQEHIVLHKVPDSRKKVSFLGGWASF